MGLFQLSPTQLVHGFREAVLNPVCSSNSLGDIAIEPGCLVQHAVLFIKKCPQEKDVDICRVVAESQPLLQPLVGRPHAIRGFFCCGILIAHYQVQTYSASAFEIVLKQTRLFLAVRSIATNHATNKQACRLNEQTMLGC